MAIFLDQFYCNLYVHVCASFSWWSLEESPARNTDVRDGRSTSPSSLRHQDVPPTARHQDRPSASRWIIILGTCISICFPPPEIPRDVSSQEYSATSGNRIADMKVQELRSGRPISNCWYSFRWPWRVYLPPCSMHTNDRRACRGKFLKGKVRAKLSSSEKWESVSRKHRIRRAVDLHNKLCRPETLAHKRFSSRFYGRGSKSGRKPAAINQRRIRDCFATRASPLSSLPFPRLLYANDSTASRPPKFSVHFHARSSSARRSWEKLRKVSGLYTIM